MPRSAQEYGELMEYTRSVLREYGFEDLNEVATGRSARLNNPKDSAVAYLRAVVDGLQGRSRRAYEQALQLNRKYIRTESDLPIEDIAVVPTDREQTIFQATETSLSDAQDLRMVTQELEQVISELESPE